MSQLARVTRGLETQITTLFTKAGDPVDPTGNVATIEILRDDGTTLVNAGTSTDRIGIGKYAYTLTTTQTASLDLLTAKWTGIIDGDPQTFTTYVEIAGGQLFDLAQARAVKGLENEAKIPDAQILEKRILVEQELEDAIVCALVPRYCRERLDGERDPILRATWPRISAVRAVTIDGTALTSSEISDQISCSGRILHRRGVWPEGYGNVEIVYEHGHRTPPMRAVDAGLTLLQHLLLEGPVSKRATTWTNPETGVTQTLLTPGTRDMLFAIPEVEAFVTQYDHHTSL